MHFVLGENQNCLGLNNCHLVSLPSEKEQYECLPKPKHWLHSK